MRGDDGAKDWGGSEVHDWGLTPPPGSTARFDRPAGMRDRDEHPADEDAADSAAPAGDEAIAGAVLAAMENGKHSSSVAGSADTKLIEYCIGAGDSAIYAIDDGRDHTMIGRGVGDDDDGCVYCLVARITRDRFEELSDGALHVQSAFDEARDISLSSVFLADHGSNVVLVQRFRRIEDVPGEYRPASPFLRFSDT